MKYLIISTRNFLLQPTEGVKFPEYFSIEEGSGWPEQIGSRAVLIL